MGTRRWTWDNAFARVLNKVTCLVGLITVGGCYMGADSISTDGGTYVLSATPKVQQFGDVLVGFCGSWRVGQDAFKMFGRMQRPSVHKFAESFKTKEEEWTILVIENERLYEVGEDLSVVEVMSDGEYAYTAVGTGGDVALGSLFADHIDVSSVTTALSAAEAHCVNVHGPFVVIETERLNDFRPNK